MDHLSNVAEADGPFVSMSSQAFEFAMPGEEFDDTTIRIEGCATESQARERLAQFVEFLKAH